MPVLQPDEPDPGAHERTELGSHEYTIPTKHHAQQRARACPGWPFNRILAEGVPGALAAEPQAWAAGSAPVPKAMPKVASALASRRDAETEREPPQPPQRRIVVMTLGVQLCLRLFGEGQQMDPPQVVHRLDLQAHERGRGGGR